VAPPLLTLQDTSLRFGATPLFADLELAIHENDRLSLVGRNGSGKSTLMKVIAGHVETDNGDRFVQPGTHICYLPQDPDLSPYATVHDYVVDGLPTSHAGEDYRAEIILQDIGLDPALPTATLSGGEGRRAALARALISEADILLLDEPTNHLDIATIEWLEERLKSYRGALVLISHDRAFLNNLTNATFWLDRGQVRRLNKGFSHFDDWSAQILEQESVETAKLDKLIAQETDWSHKGITARRKRNMGRMRRLWELRATRAELITPTGQAKLSTDSGDISGKKVIEAKSICKAFDKHVILKDFSTRILRGDRVGIIGPNGAGKSTLLKILTGDMAPDSGHVRIGTNLTPTYLDQARSLLKDDNTVWETLSDGSDHIMVRGQQRHIISYLKDFLFDPAMAKTNIGALSGGERNRLLLAKTLAQPTNFLILDEPTNDLDMDTLDLLQEMLADYDGTLLLVSHDRDFLDRIVTTTIVMEGDGRVTEYAGGYSDYLTQRDKGQAAQDDAPSLKVSGNTTKKSAPPAAQTPGTATTQPRKKLSYKHQRALDILPKEIDALEEKIQKGEAKLSEPDFYNRDPDGFARLNTLLETLRTEKDAKEEEWLEAEMLREEIEKGD